MGEEAKQEQATKAAEAPPVDQQKKEEKPAEEKPAPLEEPKPPSPFVLFVDLHCVGCAKKIQKSIMRIRGVEGVAVDMALNQVTIKGIVEPQAVCNKIMKKTKRRAKILSPLPAAEGEPVPEVVTSQVSGSTTVELNVNMHCEACAEQLKKRILKMRGVQMAETELNSGKVIVTGTMDANKLVDYVYRHTKKQAEIVPKPEPEPEQPEEKKEEGDKPAEEAKPPAADDKKEANAEKKEGDDTKPPEDEKKENNGENNNKEENNQEGAKKVDYHGMIIDHQNMHIISSTEEENMKRRMHHYYYPMYVIEQMPPAPQLFSDENPNACCIS